MTAVLFDLGNTLVAYYHREESGPILERSIGNVANELEARGIPSANREALLARAIAANRERDDFRFSPMIERLTRIFELTPEIAAADATRLCAAFLEPIFATGRVYDDARETLAALAERGHPTGIVSNAPWGSPPELWRAELDRLRITELVDGVVLCGDVGWRKPAPQIFEHAARLLGVPCAECVFVGDDPEWDVEGSRGVGMHPILIDHDGRHPGHAGPRLRRLAEVLPLVSRLSA